MLSCTMNILIYHTLLWAYIGSSFKFNKYILNIYYVSGSVLGSHEGLALEELLYTATMSALPLPPNLY